MNLNKRFIGIDGCKDGWFCVFLGEDEKWSYRVVPDAHALAEIIGDANSILIDIPVGLLDKGPDERSCDKAARKLLGAKRASSVFPAPARQALGASNYQQALSINRESTERGLSQQAWAIVPKIREIDSLIRSRKELQGVIRECHPELCFWALNGQASMQYNKKKDEGKQERLAVLQRFFPQCHELYEQASSEFLRKQVAHDDIIDAMVCAVTAKYGHGKYTTAPELPDTDSTGLVMEMVYWVPEHEVSSASVHRQGKLDDRLFDKSSRPYRQLEEVLSWRFITEVYRRYPKQFKLIEAHPGGGQYDCLTLLDFKDGWQFAIDVNRGGGSVHVHDYMPGVQSGVWPEWVREMLSAQNNGSDQANSLIR